MSVSKSQPFYILGQSDTVGSTVHCRIGQCGTSRPAVRSRNKQLPVNAVRMKVTVTPVSTAFLHAAQFATCRDRPSHVKSLTLSRQYKPSSAQPNSVDTKRIARSLSVYSIVARVMLTRKNRVFNYVPPPPSPAPKHQKANLQQQQSSLRLYLPCFRCSLTHKTWSNRCHTVPSVSARSFSSL